MKKQRKNKIESMWRRIARIWSIVIIVFTLIIIIGYAGNWVKTGTGDPYAMKNYPPAENLIPAMQLGKYCKITAIASRKLEKAQAAARRLSIERAYGSYEELLTPVRLSWCLTSE